MSRAIRFDKVALHTATLNMAKGEIEVRAYLVDPKSGATGPVFSGDLTWSERTRTAAKELAKALEADVDARLFEHPLEEEGGTSPQEDLRTFLKDDVASSI